MLSQKEGPPLEKQSIELLRNFRRNHAFDGIKEKQYTWNNRRVAKANIAKRFHGFLIFESLESENTPIESRVLTSASSLTQTVSYPCDKRRLFQTQLRMGRAPRLPYPI
jgi:hypothetical protein